MQFLMKEINWVETGRFLCNMSSIVQRNYTFSSKNWLLTDVATARSLAWVGATTCETSSLNLNFTILSTNPSMWHATLVLSKQQTADTQLPRTAHVNGSFKKMNSHIRIRCLIGKFWNRTCNFKMDILYIHVSLLRYEEICKGFCCKGYLIVLQEILEEWRTCSRNLRFWGRKVALHKINNKCFGNNIYKYKHDFCQLLELVLESKLEPIRKSCFRRSPSFYGLLVFPHTWIPLSVNGFLSGVDAPPPIPSGCCPSVRILIGWPRGSSRYRRECVGRRRSRNGGHWPFGRFPFVWDPRGSNGTFRPETRASLRERVRAFSCV